MSDNIEKVIRSEIGKKLLPDRAFNPKVMNLIEKFMKVHKEMVKFIIKKNIKNNDSYLKNEVKEELNKFMKFDMVSLKNNKHYRINYMITFMMLIDKAEFRSVDDEVVTHRDIDESLSNYSDIDYFILLCCNITMSRLWLLLEKEEQDELVKYLNNMYMYSYMMYNKYIKKNYEFFYKDQKIPCIIYKSRLHGKGEVIRTIITESINRNKLINNTAYRKEVTNEANEVIKETIESMVNNKINDDRELNIGEKGISPKLVKSVYEANDRIQKGLKNGKLNVNTLCDVGVSLLKSYKNNPDAVKNYPQFKMMVSYIVQAMEVSKNNGQKLSPAAERIYKLLKNSFYDPKTNMSAAERRTIQRMMSGRGRMKYKFRK